jgi:hypothetical protein
MDQTSSEANSRGAITYLIHHMFLPPQLPHKDDFDLSHEKFMLETTLGGLSRFKQCLPPPQRQITDSVIAMIMSLQATNQTSGSTGGSPEECFRETLKQLDTQGK